MTGLLVPHSGLQRQYKNLGAELLNATHDAMKDGQLVGGHFTRSFEEWLKHKTKTRYAITVHSGTQALEIIARYKHSYLLRTQIAKPTIRVPNLTYPATLNAFITAGWDIELADTDNFGVIEYDNALSCIVGLYGRKPWSERLFKSDNVIVDGAQHWLVADGQVGLGMAISFDPTKNLNSSGNGGAIVTNDEHLYMYASNYKDNSKPYFQTVGTNSKMSEIDCAHLMVRVSYLDRWQLRRQKIAKYWNDSFRNLPLTCLSDSPVANAHQKYVIYMSDRNSMHTHLVLNGITSKISYEYVLGDLDSGKDFPKPDMMSTSVMLSRGVLGLPMYPELTDSEVEYISDKVHEFHA